MAFSAKIDVSDATPLANADCGLLHVSRAPGDWKFELGDCTTHKTQALPGFVVDRHESGRHQVYTVISTATFDNNRARMVMGDSLTRVTPESCGECLLYSMALCPHQ